MKIAAAVSAVPSVAGLREFGSGQEPAKAKVIFEQTKGVLHLD